MPTDLQLSAKFAYIIKRNYKLILYQLTDITNRFYTIQVVYMVLPMYLSTLIQIKINMYMLMFVSLRKSQKSHEFPLSANIKKAHMGVMVSCPQTFGHVLYLHVLVSEMIIYHLYMINDLHNKYILPSDKSHFCCATAIASGYTVSLGSNTAASIITFFFVFFVRGVGVGQQQIKKSESPDIKSALPGC